jgi:hypothetical protein
VYDVYCNLSFRFSITRAPHEREEAAQSESCSHTTINNNHHVTDDRWMAEGCFYVFTAIFFPFYDDPSSLITPHTLLTRSHSRAAQHHHSSHTTAARREHARVNNTACALISLASRHCAGSLSRSFPKEMLASASRIPRRRAREPRGDTVPYTVQYASHCTL